MSSGQFFPNPNASLERTGGSKRKFVVKSRNFFCSCSINQLFHYRINDATFPFIATY